MSLKPNQKLYEAANTKGIKGPRPQIGMMCHHMIVDLLERAGLIKMAQAKLAGRFGRDSMGMARILLARDNFDVPLPLKGGKLKEAIKMQSVVICLYNQIQKPAHSLVTMGDGKVAGYNNVGSTKPESKHGEIKYEVFNADDILWDQYEVWGASPMEIAARINSLK